MKGRHRLSESRSDQLTTFIDIGRTAIYACAGAKCVKPHFSALNSQQRFSHNRIVSPSVAEGLPYRGRPLPRISRRREPSRHIGPPCPHRLRHEAKFHAHGKTAATLCAYYHQSILDWPDRTPRRPIRSIPVILPQKCTKTWPRRFLPACRDLLMRGW